MTRAVPILASATLEKSQAEDADLVFVVIRHPDLDGAIRLVQDGADYIYDGWTWSKAGFDLTLLTDGDTPPRAKFRFQNVDRVAIARLRHVVGPPRVEFRVVTSAYFDLSVEPRVVKAGLTVQPAYTASALFLTDVSADDIAVEGTLRSWDYRQESWPDIRATQALLPGAFLK